MFTPAELILDPESYLSWGKEEKPMIRSIEEDGYSWVEISEDSWASAVYTTYMFGMPVD